MEQSSAETVLRFPSEVVRYWILWLRFWSFPDEKTENLSFHWLMLPTVKIFHLTVFLFFSNFLSKKKKNICSLVITGVNIYQHLLMKFQKRCCATAPVGNFLATFPETIFLRAACSATFQCLNHYPFSYIFISIKFTFLVCMSFNFCNDGWAGRER